jgi:hypothetical protein
VLASLPVARSRPVFNPGLGKFFKDLRAERGWSVRGASVRAGDKGLAALSYQVLFRLERGQVKNPEPDVMRALSALYGQRYEDVVNRFVALRFGLSSTAADAIPAPAKPPRPPSALRRLGRAQQLLEQLNDLGLRKAVDYLEILAPAHPLRPLALAEKEPPLREFAEVHELLGKVPLPTRAPARSRAAGSTREHFPAARTRSERAPHRPSGPRKPGT